MKKISFSLLFILLLACKANKVAMKSTETTPYKTIAEAKLGADIIFLMNEKKDYVLCIKTATAPTGNPQKTVNYLVINLNTNKVVLQDKQENATVKWHDATHIEVFHIPGVVREDQNRNDFITLYNVVSGEVTYPKITNQEKYKQLAIDKLGDNVAYYFNDAKTYVLCVHEVKGSSLKPQNQITYLVYNLSNNSLALEGSVSGGTVGWFNANEIEVYNAPGTMRKDESNDDYTTLINVKSKEKRSKADTKSY